MTDPTSPFDLILRDALIVDGTGAPSRQGDLAVRGDRIVALGTNVDGPASREIALGGKVVSPGFIDAHTHDDRAVIDTPQMLPKISQGVTSVVVGNCGISLSPIVLDGDPPPPMNLLGDRSVFRYPRVADYVAAVDAARPAVNVAALAQISVVGFLLGPPLLGYVAEHFGIRWAFGIGLPLIVLSLITASALGSRPPKAVPAQ